MCCVWGGCLPMYTNKAMRITHAHVCIITIIIINRKSEWAFYLSRYPTVFFNWISIGMVLFCPLTSPSPCARCTPPCTFHTRTTHNTHTGCCALAMFFAILLLWTDTSAQWSNSYTPTACPLPVPCTCSAINGTHMGGGSSGLSMSNISTAGGVTPPEGTV